MLEAYRASWVKFSKVVILLSSKKRIQICLIFRLKFKVQFQVFLIEVSLEREQIYWMYQLLFENLQICRNDATTVVSTFLQEGFSHENEKLHWNEAFSARKCLSRKLIFSQFFFFPENWFTHDDVSTGKVDLCEVFQFFSFHRTENDKTVHSRRENSTFPRFFQIFRLVWKK